MSEALWTVVWFFNHAVLVYFVLLNGVYLATTFLAFGVLRRLSIALRSIDSVEVVS